MSHGTLFLLKENLVSSYKYNSLITKETHNMWLHT